MKKFPVILDLETKYSFKDFSDPKKLQVSVAVIYDYKDGKPKTFEEKQLGNLFSILEASSYIIGYNVISFDIAVLQAYYPGNIEVFSAFDILEDIKAKIGKRVALNEVIKATLGKQKSSNGLQAINFYHEGKIEELKKYCLDDVMLTKELFDYGVKNGEIFYLTPFGKQSIKVDWKKYLESDEKKDIPLTLPF